MQNVKRFALEKKLLFIRAAAVLLPVAIALMLSQTAFAEMTYVITDGSRVLVHTTSSTDPKDVLGEAGFRLGADDTYTTHTGEDGSQIHIQRSQKVLIDYYGEQMAVSTRGETVEALLQRLNLVWNPGDRVSQAMSAQTYDGMELEISSVLHEEQTYAAVLPHGTVYCTDPSLPAGEERVLTEGADGQAMCRAEVTYINGVETERRMLSERVTLQPVDEVIARGAAAEPRNGGEDLMPVIGDGTITLATGEVLTYTDVISSLATAYCDKGLTATGTQARVGAIAVDPRYIPYGTRMFIVSDDGEYIYGLATAEDTGSREHIVGRRIDLHYDTRYECIQFGARRCTVYILG